MIIREMKTEDKVALRELYLTSRMHTFTWLPTSELQLKDFDEETKEEYLLVAEHQKRLVGFVSFYVPDDFIHLLFVDPLYLKKGIGHQLLAEAKRRLHQPIRLKCLSKNTEALAFYQKEGWQKIKEVPGTAPYWELIYDGSMTR